MAIALSSSTFGGQNHIMYQSKLGGWKHDMGAFTLSCNGAFHLKLQRNWGTHRDAGA